MSLAERMKKEREGSAQTTGKVVRKPGVVGMSGGGKKNLPVGLSSEEPKRSKNAIRKERQRQAKERAAKAERLEEEEKKKAEEEAAKASADPAKRAKKIKKLLKQIDELKQKDAGSLNDDQKSKVATEDALREELAGLNI